MLEARVICSTRGFIKNVHHKNNLALESRLALQDHDGLKDDRKKQTIKFAS